MSEAKRADASGRTAEGPKGPTRGDGKAVAVLVRMTAEQAAVLDEVAALPPVVASRPAAVRRMIEHLRDDELRGGARRRKRRAAPVAVLGRDVADAVLEALEARTQAYVELAKQVRAIGTQNNQMVKLGHQAVTYGRDAVIPAEAVQAFDRRVSEVQKQLERLAEQDSATEIALRERAPR